ncbi:hypothetical protein WDU94_011065 [Cyamophila willieti]
MLYCSIHLITTTSDHKSPSSSIYCLFKARPTPTCNLSTVKMFRQIIQLHVLLTLIHCITAAGEDNAEDSSGTPWKDVDVKGNAWKGISAFLGKNLCDTDVGMCKSNFSGFVANHHNVPGFQRPHVIAVCETDKNLKKAVVCWVRYKPTNNNGADETTLEVQFWSDNPQVSHCRYAEP